MYFCSNRNVERDILADVFKILSLCREWSRLEKLRDKDKVGEWVLAYTFVGH